MLYDKRWEKPLDLPKVHSPVKQLLIDAKKLIEKEENWCRLKMVIHYDDREPQYCSVGALDKAVGGLNNSVENMAMVVKAKHVLDAATKSNNIIGFNDNRPHAEVMAAWDKAIDSIE